MPRDYTSRDFKSIKNDLINRLQSAAPELTNKNESEFAIVVIDLFSYIGDLLSYSVDSHALESFLMTARQRENVIRSCNLLNYKLENSKPSEVDLIFYIEDPILKDIIIPAGTKCYTSGNEKIFFETDEICIIESGNVSKTVKAIQGVTNYKILGYSNGEADQSFFINDRNILDNIEIYSGNKKFIEVQSFIGSGSNDTHFTSKNIEASLIEINFGNGLNGIIPPVDSQILAIYRTGSGIEGNVGANTIINIDSEIFDSDNEVVDVKVYNIDNAIGGMEPESIESAKLHAPARQYTLWRAVTEEDFKQLALTQKDIEKASVIVDYDNNKVNIYIKSYESEQVKPEKLLELKEFFLERALIGIDFEIHAAEFIDINLNITAKIFQRYSREVVRNNIQNLLNSSAAINDADFGQLPITGQIIKEIMEIDGVMNVDIDLDEINIANNQLARINIGNMHIFGGE